MAVCGDTVMSVCGHTVMAVCGDTNRGGCVIGMGLLREDTQHYLKTLQRFFKKVNSVIPSL